jgi:two-component system, chemotaxis family, CheB/CheR fusion protein
MAQAARRKKSTPRQRKPARPGDTPAVPVVAVGASAGGLEPISQFLAAMPVDAGLAVIVIQHLDPTSKSMLPQLLARRSALNVSLAEDGIALEPNQVYVIPPAVFLSIASGRLCFSPAQTGKGARMPIDVFLHSLAADRGRHGIGIIMSGTGTDGADGLKALKEAGGLVLVQDPNEAQQDGMPRYAMRTARPDYVLPVRDMPTVLTRYVTHNYVKARHPTPAMQETSTGTPSELTPLVEILKSSAGLNFSDYKTGTLQRRIERRMALNGVARWPEYLALLRNSPAEADALAKDLLINVTGFFRDPEAFATLTGLMPELLSHHPPDQPLRIWVVGCSTGEEAYSLAMLVLEQIATSHLRLQLQIFATDVDEDALQVARAGVYPESVQADVTPDRLRQFFIRENGHFRVAQELRKVVIFSRHDVLHDPPFSRLDLVSCRNVLIYLLPEAQRQLLMLLHFALRTAGLLFLGAAESLGPVQALFEPLNEKFRLFRRSGDGRLARTGFSLSERVRMSAVLDRLAPANMRSQPSLGELVERTMLETYAPAAVVTNRQFAPLYFFGETDRYLQIVAGEPGQDLLSMAREGLRPKLRETIARALRGKRRIAAHGVWLKRESRTTSVTIQAQRLSNGQGDLVLVSFIDEPRVLRNDLRSRAGRQGDNAELAQLRQQLTDTRRELNRTILDLREANQELKVKNEEAMSLNEEFLSTNEELESSKEELQSLNEELTTVNAQLRQTLEQQQQASTDLSNLLNSSSVATIFLDAQLRIKIFNPRMQELFSLIDSDIGRPLADLLPKFADPSLLADATAAQSSGTPSEREIRAEQGGWYLRTVAPYRIEARQIAGAVVTFADVSGLKLAEINSTAAQRLAEEAQATAERANQGKSRFLAAASHDIRQPLQTMELLHGVLERRVVDPESRTTLAQLGDAVAHMTELLDSLLDMNRLESGEISPEIMDFSVAPVLARACEELAPVAASKSLQLRVVPCSSVIRSDRRLLARMLSNLLTNAIKYTDHGKVLVGCRHRGDTLRIAIREVRRAMGEQLPAVVVSADRSSAVRRAIEADGLKSVSKPVRTANLVAAVEALVRIAKPGWQRTAWPRVPLALVAEAPSEASVAVIDDESSVREALRKVLETDGYKVATFPSGQAFFAHAERGRFRCLVVDLNLPGMNGLALQDRLKRERSGTPVIFVTGSGTLSYAVQAMREGAADFLQKPVRAEALRESVNRILASGEQVAGERAQSDAVAARLATLTGRERQVTDRVVVGQATKNIAAELRISERTVEHHRHSVMRKIGATSLAMLVRLVAPHITEH